jgi:para-aminobenzoate synthetase/4-amino-4-deoxychorismate lyase
VRDGTAFGTVCVALEDGRERIFARPVEVVTANALSEVGLALRRVQSAVDRGWYAAGFIAYEAGPAFDSALEAHAPWPRLPLVWFGIYNICYDHPAPRMLSGGFRTGAWEPLVSEAEYAAALDRIREHIAAGDTYQVNYTFPLRAEFEGDALAWFRQLRLAQGGGHAAYVDAGRFKVVSVSPELFFELSSDVLVTRPMKGTRPRGLWSGEDLDLARALADSEKDRAENIMITDLLRNDLGRISPAGAVHASRLFEVEQYHTVWQMTSTVAAQTQASVPAILGALFPSGSVTGAPKIQTSKIIRALESHPRGVYCGAVGWWGPRRRAHFNVAIRTVLVDAEAGAAHYHVGSGVTWDSQTGQEYRECLDKAAVLSHARPAFDLLETLRWEDGEYFLLDEHLVRLRESARYFARPYDEDTARRALDAAVEGAQSPRRVRLLLGPGGALNATHEDLAMDDRPLRVAMAKDPVDTGDVFLYHKTTHRAVYEAARASRPDAGDVILWNARGEVTESTIANVVVEIGGEKVTPPVSCGLLGGVMRARLLAEGAVREGVVTVDALRRARRFWLVNSVRGWVDAHWADGPA